MSKRQKKLKTHLYVIIFPLPLIWSLENSFSNLCMKPNARFLESKVIVNAHILYTDGVNRMTPQPVDETHHSKMLASPQFFLLILASTPNDIRRAEFRQLIQC